MRLSIRTKLFLMLFSVIVMVSGSIGSYFYFNARTALMVSLQQRLQSSAALIARNIQASELRGIDASEDVDKPAYAHYLGVLREWVRSNADLAYIYIMQLRDSGQVSFVVDSDESSEQALPGTPYAPLNDRLLEGFERPSVDSELTSDQWGAFLTGYAPIQGGRGEYLLGIDMRADEVEAKFRQLHLSGLVSLMLSVVLAWLLSAWFSRQYLRPVHAVIARCREIADGHYGERIELSTRDELDTLIGAFNQMSSHLQQDAQAIADARQSLERQREEMEAQIQRRLADLTALNSDLLRENRQLKDSASQLSEILRRDETTGLYNRRAVLERLEELRSQAQRGGRGFSIILILCECQREGVSVMSNAVDEALRRFARNLESRLGEGEILARWDSTQFLLVLPNRSEADAERLAVQLADAFGVHDSMASAGEVMTRFYGVSEYRLGDSIGACLDRAWLSLPK